MMVLIVTMMVVVDSDDDGNVCKEGILVGCVAAEEIECGAPPARTKPQYGSCWICINEAGDDGDGRDFDVDDGDY